MDEMEKKEKKSMFLAWISNVVPGIGLIYVGKNGLGITFIIVAGICLLLCLTGIGAIIGLPLYILLSLIACILSAVGASKHNKSIAEHGQ